MPESLRLAILFSGSGTTLQNLIDATRDGRLPDAEVVQAISSRDNVAGIDRCAAAGVACAVVAKKQYADPAEHTRAVFARIDPEQVDYVILAGWMSRLVLEAPWLDNRVLNIHPSLLPAFGGPGLYGNRVHEAVLARGCRVTGCTVHFVDNEIDGGPILAQRAIDIDPTKLTADDLAARVQVVERELYVDVIRGLSR
jgi:formyltetrahydrofolate-dependent phosphoribosylglycinamide formyltransferase